MRILLCIAGIAAAAVPAAAQQPAPQVERIGRIIAVVGDSAILNFDLQNALLAREAQGQQLPEAGPARERLVQELLEERINELVLVQAALRDTSIIIQDEQINRAVQAEIDERQAALGGPVAFEQALAQSGMTMIAYRDLLTQQQRRRSLIDQFIARRMQGRKPPPISDQALQQAYEQRLPQLERRPATVTFQQVVVRTQPSPEDLARTKLRADSIFERSATARTSSNSRAASARMARASAAATSASSAATTWYASSRTSPSRCGPAR
jgi:hypothetical protein